MAEEKDVRSANVSLHNANDNDFLQPNYRSWALNYRSSGKLTLILTFHLISLITQRINETTNYPTLAEITLFLTFLPSKNLSKNIFSVWFKNDSRVLKTIFLFEKILFEGHFTRWFVLPVDPFSTVNPDFKDFENFPTNSNKP